MNGCCCLTIYLFLEKSQLELVGRRNSLDYFQLLAVICRAGAQLLIVIM